jgi:hypothetical protein
MNEYGAIINDGVPDDLGQSGSGVLTDETLQVAWQMRWRMVNGRMMIEFEQKIDARHVSTLRGDGRSNARATTTVD